MSNIQTLKIIKSPLLSDANFGERVNDTFNDINDNFGKIASYDYIKGEEGRGLWLQAYNLVNDKEGSTLAADSISDAIIRTIVSATPGTQVDLEALYIMYAKKFLSEEGGGIIYLIYDSRLEGVDTSSESWKRGGWMEGLVGCIPWTYLDPRFAAETISITETVGQTDMSGVLTWQANEEAIGGSFNISHPFPTLYYNTDAGQFCWVVNGNKTGLPAQGPSGKDGTPGNIIVCCTDSSQSTSGDVASRTGTFAISSYLTGATGGAVSEIVGWVEVTDPIPSWEGATAIVYWGNPEEGNVEQQQYWIATIQMINTSTAGDGNVKERMVVYLSESNVIDTVLDAESITGVFMNMFSNGMNGFLIPFKSSSNDNAHVFTADSLPKREDTAASTGNNQLLIMPSPAGDTEFEEDAAGNKIFKASVRNKITVTATAKEGDTEYTLTGFDSTSGKWRWDDPNGNQTLTDSAHGDSEIFSKVTVTYGDGSLPVKAHAVLGYDVAVLGDLYVEGISGARITESEIDQMFDRIF